MTTEDLKQIGELLEPIKRDMKGMATKSDVAEIKTTLKALEAGQDDIREKMATKQDVEATVEAAKLEVKAEILTLNARLVKTVQNHEKRIDNLEVSTHTDDPTKH